ncbi:hypothetical protein EI94DRAFT_1703844 [Lactarius quietus]|nr:hypothetical protein EI94DRAFT_1703844 [Lactarius quietus]
MTPHLPPLMLPVPLMSELDRIALILADAFLDCDRLPRKPANSRSKNAQDTEGSLRRQYPPLDSLAAKIPISKPCIIVDMQGVLLAWYLPRILKDSRQREMMAATETLHPLLDTHQGSALWRNDPKHFSSKTVGPKGVVTLSPAWFQQAHNTVQEFPNVCATFKQPAALDWLDAISTSNAILSATLAVIHPQLHDAGQETFNRLRQHPEIQPQDVLHRWTSVFNGVSVICNH